MLNPLNFPAGASCSAAIPPNRGWSSAPATGPSSSQPTPDGPPRLQAAHGGQPCPFAASPQSGARHRGLPSLRSRSSLQRSWARAHSTWRQAVALPRRRRPPTLPRRWLERRGPLMGPAAVIRGGSRRARPSKSTEAPRRRAGNPLGANHHEADALSRRLRRGNPRNSAGAWRRSRLRLRLRYLRCRRNPDDAPIAKDVQIYV